MNGALKRSIIFRGDAINNLGVHELHETDTLQLFVMIIDFSRNFAHRIRHFLHRRWTIQLLECIQDLKTIWVGIDPNVLQRFQFLRLVHL
ncbi:hypothetical protein D3C81_1678720 [compost metagenome]